MKKRRRFSLSTTQIILLAFLLVILVGSALLSLPISIADGKNVPYIDALFTATTATCVTGLVTLPVVSTWSFFGQVVILLLMQIGGLGIITIMAGVMLALHRKMGLSDRLLLQDAFNLNTLAGLSSFVKKVILGTLVIEGGGALLYMVVFVPQFGARGIWISIFGAVSAFCNAGMDVLAEDSLCGYATHPLVNAVTCFLIILGGIGYIVWWDLMRVIKQRKRLRHLTLHSKIALLASVCFILGGAVAFLLFEYQNPVIKEYSFFNKMQVALFQAVTTRTAGFATIPQQALSNASAIVSLLLMFIGGSPVGTAGGIKTVTIIVLLASAIATFKNKNEATLFQRRITRQAVAKAVAVTGMSAWIVFLSTLLLSLVIDAPFLDILYEAVSATATVGLTRGVTPFLNVTGKWIVIVTMYLGRVGPISLAIAFQMKKENQNIVKNPAEEISVG